MDTVTSPEHPPVADPRDAAEAVGRDGVAPLAQVGSLLFADLVDAHFTWERARHGDDPDEIARLRRIYEAKLADFCESEGGILGVYWCTLEPSAVILTQGPQTRWQRLLGEHPHRLHRVSNWMMPRSAHKLVTVLHDCDELAIRAGEILRGVPRRIALRGMYELEAELLAFLERARGRPHAAEIDEFTADANRRLRKARADYDNAADEIVRMVYVGGMLGGVVLIPPIAVLAAIAIRVFGPLDLQAASTQAFFACMAAGALGAVVSVLTRMASPAKFGLDPAVGRRPIFFLGVFRPLVGAIFGVALYFLIQSSLLQASMNNQFATYVVVAFLGGFSERFVKVMLHTAEGTASGAGGPNGEKAASAGTGE